MKSKSEINRIYKEVEELYLKIKESKNKALDKSISKEERVKIADDYFILCTELKLLVADAFED